MSAIEDEIRAMVAEALQKPAAELGPGTALEGSGIDSLGLVHLMVSLEERFGIAFRPGETPADMAIETIAGLARMVERMIAEQKGAAR